MLTASHATPCSEKTTSPFVRRFRAGHIDFCLDVHTNRIFRLSVREAEALDAWLSGTALAQLAARFPDEVAQFERLRSEGAFRCDRPSRLAFGAPWAELAEDMAHRRRQTILELTQHCNLRCRYCTFGGGFPDRRLHSSRTMSRKTVEAAVLSALSHGDRLDEIVIGFYGGEPLAAWDTLVAAVRIAQAKRGKQKVRFSLTSNATLLDSEKARFLRDIEAHVLVSLDGPRELHDRHRVFPQGDGSYSATIRGLRCLLEIYGEEKRGLLALNMVVPGREWLGELERLWDDEPWIPRDLQARAQIVTPPEGFCFPPVPARADPWTFERSWMARLASGTHGCTSLASNQFDVPLARLHQRPIFARRQGFFPNGCCVPGTRRIYVDANGDYRLCERVFGLPAIGSVTTGLDFRALRRLIDDYCQHSLPDCRDCWAVSLCRLCYGEAYRDGQLDLQKKRQACVGMRRALQRDLAIYGLVSLRYPAQLQKWEEFQFE